MERPYDMHGIPIYAGDVLRTFHYNDRKHSRRKMYLYHAVIDDHGRLEAVPVRELATGNHDGGRFWLTGQVDCSEIVQGSGPESLMEFTDRPRKQETK